MAAAEIFQLNLPVLPMVAQLRQAGYPMGILSNTCEMHWDYCFEHYRIVSEGFGVHALSYEIGAIKPDAAIFRAAAEVGRLSAGGDFLRRRLARARGRRTGGRLRRRAIHVGRIAGR